MIAPTCAVTLAHPAKSGRDALGIPVRAEPVREVVEGVLVDAIEGTGTQATGEGQTRTAQAALTLHFPRTHHGSLLGCTVTLPPPWEGEWRVVGDPMPYDARLCPGPFDRAVRVVRPDN